MGLSKWRTWVTYTIIVLFIFTLAVTFECARQLDSKQEQIDSLTNEIIELNTAYKASIDRLTLRVESNEQILTATQERLSGYMEVVDSFGDELMQINGFMLDKFQFTFTED